MHSANTDKQNAEISEAFTRVDKLYNRAIRRPNPERCRLSEGLGEVLWKSRNLRYREAMALLRHAEGMFSMVLEAECIEDAMDDFTVRPEEAQYFEAVAISKVDLKKTHLPVGTMLLVPRGRGTSCRMALAA